MPTIPEQLHLIPDRPGVYLFKDTAGAVLYVGKAKILKNRVRSYFQAGAALEPAKQDMVPKVVTIETITTDTENEALVLEANLIQKYKPPYNVILRDDKFYLFIKITKEEFPRVLLVRRLIKDGSRYFGPYSSARAVRGTLSLLQRIFPFRGENDTKRRWVFTHPLFHDNKGLVTEATNAAAYTETINHIIRFLKGDRADLIHILEEGMREATHNKAFEQAALFRDQLQAIKRLDDQQKVYLPDLMSCDAISLVRKPTQSAVNVFSIRGGKLLNKNTFLLKHRSTATEADILRQFVLQYYSVAQDIPPILLTPLTLPDEAELSAWIYPSHPPTFITPRRGPKKELLTLGELNAKELFIREDRLTFNASRRKQALVQLATALGLPSVTLSRIETYDISNIQGTLATGSMVVFEDGSPRPAQYKRFKIAGLTTPNDFAMLSEVLRRRFSGRHTDWPIPNLIVIDGGKGQLSSSVAILHELGVRVPVIALAKQQEEIFLPGRSTSIRLPYDSDALYLMQQMRDEAHRFTITYHRTLRKKQQTRSILDEVPGIGPKTKKKLLRHFGSLQRIREASDQELTTLIGSKAKTLKDYL